MDGRTKKGVEQWSNWHTCRNSWMDKLTNCKTTTLQAGWIDFDITTLKTH